MWGFDAPWGAAGVRVGGEWLKGRVAFQAQSAVLLQCSTTPTPRPRRRLILLKDAEEAGSQHDVHPHREYADSRGARV